MNEKPGDMRDRTVAIYVADPDPEFLQRVIVDEEFVDEEFRDENAVERHSKPLQGTRAGKVVQVPLSALRDSWAETAEMLATLGDSVDDTSPTWGLDTIEVGLTLGAEGTLWIATASAQASVKFTLKRRQVSPERPESL